MMKIITSPYRLNVTVHARLHLVHSRRRFFDNLNTANKVNIKWQQMKRDEDLADKARSLIFGEKKYIDLEPFEQKIVDLYQEKKIEEDGVILPNTRAALEQAEVEQMLIKRFHDKLN